MKPITKQIAKCGIYCIVNTINQKRYIGSSLNCYLRLLDHRAELRHNVHANKHLQNAWNKYGESNFQYFILEFCKPDIRIEREAFYIEQLQAEYNIIKNPEKVEISEESRKKMSESRLNAFRNGTLIPYQCIKIYKYDKSGNFVEEYNSIKEACEKNNIHVSSMIVYFKNNYSQLKGFIWKKEKYDKIEPYKKKERNMSYLYKPLIMKNLETNEIVEFKSIKDCAKYFNKCSITIQQVLKGKNRIYLKKYLINYKTAV